MKVGSAEVSSGLKWTNEQAEMTFVSHDFLHDPGSTKTVDSLNALQKALAHVCRSEPGAPWCTDCCSYDEFEQLPNSYAFRAIYWVAQHIPNAFPFPAASSQHMLRIG